MIMAIPANAQLTINIRYSGAKGAAKKYVKEMEQSGIADRIRAVEGCLRYDYFFPADDPDGLLLIDEWADQAALDRYHASPMMKEAAALREKYKLGGRQIRMFNPLVRNPQSEKTTQTMDIALTPRAACSGDHHCDSRRCQALARGCSRQLDAAPDLSQGCAGRRFQRVAGTRERRAVWFPVMFRHADSFRLWRVRWITDGRRSGAGRAPVRWW